MEEESKRAGVVLSYDLDRASLLYRLARRYNMKRTRAALKRLFDPKKHDGHDTE